MQCTLFIYERRKYTCVAQVAILICKPNENSLLSVVCPLYFRTEEVEEKQTAAAAAVELRGALQQLLPALPSPTIYTNTVHCKATLALLHVNIYFLPWCL